jgi:hypothetical protein
LAGSRITRGKHTRNPSSRPTSEILCRTLTCVTRATAELPFHFTGSAARSYERGQRRKCSPVVALPTLVTNRQPMAIINALNGRSIFALQADLEGAWIQSSLDRKALSLRITQHVKVLPHSDRASRPRVELTTCEFQSTTTARYLAPHRRGGGKAVQRARLLRLRPGSITYISYIIYNL